MAYEPVPPRVLAEYFDGQQARGHLVLLEWTDDALCLRLPSPPHAVLRRIPHAQVQWSEPVRHGVPQAHVAGGGSLRALEAAPWHAWLAQHRPHPVSWVVRAQQSWRGVAVALVLLLAVAAGLWRWGIPLATQAVVPLVPVALEQRLGDEALAWLDRDLMRPSKLSGAHRRGIEQSFAALLKDRPHPAYVLHFRSSRIGPNAFALPGGAVVLTDEMVDMMGVDEDVVLGVLAHELGHLHHRHGTQQLVQGTLLAAITTLVLGDVSSWLVSVPVMLGQAGYSREAEREADAYAARTLAAGGISPAVMERLFDALAARQQATAPKANTPSQQEAMDVAHTLGIAIASHPDDDERRRFFREAALSLSR
ncbi:M48 family metallopeptidase [Hydrogenophaga soli]